MGVLSWNHANDVYSSPWDDDCQQIQVLKNLNMATSSETHAGVDPISHPPTPERETRRAPLSQALIGLANPEANGERTRSTGSRILAVEGCHIYNLILKLKSEHGALDEHIENSSPRFKIHITFYLFLSA